VKRIKIFWLCASVAIFAGCVKKELIRSEGPVDCFGNCKDEYELCQKVAEEHRKKCVSKWLKKTKCDSDYIDEKSDCIDSKVDCQNKCY